MSDTKAETPPVVVAIVGPWYPAKLLVDESIRVEPLPPKSIEYISRKKAGKATPNALRDALHAMITRPK